MNNINHAERARRLTDLIAGESKVNDDSVVDSGVFLENDPPVVPFRYACPTYDGSYTWFMFADELDAMCADLASEVTAEVPYAPGEITDLDTGDAYRTFVSVACCPEDSWRKAFAVRNRLNAGEAVWAALNAEGFDADDDIVSEDCSVLDVDDMENNVIDFCDGVLLRRVGAHVRRGKDHFPVLVNPGRWEIEPS